MKRFLSWLFLVAVYFLYAIIASLMALVIGFIIDKFLDQTLLGMILSIMIGGGAFLAFVLFGSTLCSGLTICTSEKICPSKSGTRYTVFSAITITLAGLDLLSVILFGSDISIRQKIICDILYIIFGITVAVEKKDYVG